MQDYVITIGRQFGSGGRELARLLAEKLSIPYYDKDLLMEAARESGVNPDFFVNNDERAPKFLSNIIPYGYGVNLMPWYNAGSQISDDNIYHTQSDLIRQIASRGPCIIVGRSADYVLRDHPRLLSVFIHANPEDCAVRIVHRNDSTEIAKAIKMAERVNKLRANYYNFYTDKRWGDASSYDMCFNSSKLTISQIADQIVAAVNQIAAY